jgi:hypothetical protein
MCGHSRRKTLGRPAVLARVSGSASCRVSSGGSAVSSDQPAPAALSANPPRSLGLLETESGLDITQRVTELLWLACERGYLTFEMVHQAFSGDGLTSDDLTTVCLKLGQAGVELVDASTVESVQSAAVGEGDKNPGESIAGNQDINASQGEAIQPEGQQDEL